MSNSIFMNKIYYIESRAFSKPSDVPRAFFYEFIFMQIQKEKRTRYGQYAEFLRAFFTLKRKGVYRVSGKVFSIFKPIILKK